MENLKKSKENKLTKKQQKAIELLIYEGMKKKDVAIILEVRPETISAWLNVGKTPYFVEAYNAELENAKNLRMRNYKTAAQSAQNKLFELANCKNKEVALKAVKEILDRAGDRPTSDININSPQISEKLADVFAQLRGEGLEE